MGFFQKNSNTLVPFEGCLVLNERAQAALSDIRDIMKTSLMKNLVSLEIHAPQDEILVRALCRGKSRRRDLDQLGKLFELLKIHGLSYISPENGPREYVFGEDFCSYNILVHGTHLKMSTGFGGFIQANSAVNEALTAHVVNLAKGSRKVLDLYCGNGNFSIPLALSAHEVVGVEMDRHLTELGRINAGSNGLTNVTFSCMDAKHFMASRVCASGSFDTVVLDPPREGAKAIMASLARLRPDRIISISCNPSTLSRDLAVLIGEGYTLKEVRLFDMFPQTYHIESVSYLQR
jgi:23S rRNA (uracil1939-C5)-methyltransferase